MKKILLFIFITIINISVQGENTQNKDIYNGINDTTNKIKINIIVEGETYGAYLIKNKATEELIKHMPFTIYMDREYNYYSATLDNGTLPVDSLEHGAFTEKMIGYYPAQNMMVISYSFHCPQLSVEPLGYITDGMYRFKDFAESTEFTFELKKK